MNAYEIEKQALLAKKDPIEFENYTGSKWTKEKADYLWNLYITEAKPCIESAEENVVLRRKLDELNRKKAVLERDLYLKRMGASKTKKMRSVMKAHLYINRCYYFFCFLLSLSFVALFWLYFKDLREELNLIIGILFHLVYLAFAASFLIIIPMAGYPTAICGDDKYSVHDFYLNQVLGSEMKQGWLGEELAECGACFARSSLAYVCVYSIFLLIEAAAILMFFVCLFHLFFEENYLWTLIVVIVTFFVTCGIIAGTGEALKSPIKSVLIKIGTIILIPVALYGCSFDFWKSFQFLLSHITQ